MRSAWVWKSALRKCVDASPLVVKYSCGRVLALVGSHAHLVACVDLQSGRRVWTRRVHGRVEGPAAVSAGGRIIILGTYSSRVYLLHAATGLVLARVHAGDAVKGGAVVDPVSNAMYFGAHDGKVRRVGLCDPALYATYAGGGLLVVDLRDLDGDNAEGGQAGRGWEGAVFSAPAPLLADDGEGGWSEQEERVGRRMIVCSTRGQVACLQFPTLAQGRERAEAAEMLWLAHVGAPVFGSAVVLSCGKLEQAVGGGAEGEARVVGGGAAAGGECEGEKSGLLVLVGCANSSLVAMSAFGQQLWRFETEGPVMSSPLPVSMLTPRRSLSPGARADCFPGSIGGRDSELGAGPGASGREVELTWPAGGARNGGEGEGGKREKADGCGDTVRVIVLGCQMGFTYCLWVGLWGCKLRWKRLLVPGSQAPVSGQWWCRVCVYVCGGKGCVCARTRVCLCLCVFVRLRVCVWRQEAAVCVRVKGRVVVDSGKEG